MVGQRVGPWADLMAVYLAALTAGWRVDQSVARMVG